MKLILAFVLACCTVETVYCSNLWHYLTLLRGENSDQADDGMVMPVQDELDRQKRLSISTTYTYDLYGGSGGSGGFGSGEAPVTPDPVIPSLPFKQCVPYYIANRINDIALPPGCRPLPSPSASCDCPNPDDVKTAGDDVILDELNIEVQVHSQYVNVTVDAVVFNPHDGVQLADFNLRLPDQAFISYFHIVVNNEVLVANIEEKEKAEKTFRESVRRGQTAATVEARGKNEFTTNVAVSRHCRMRFQLRYEYLVEANAGQLRVPIQVTPSIPALTRRLKIYIDDKKPISCVKPEGGSGYDGVVFNMTSENEAELNTELTPNQTREFVLIYKLKIDSKTPGTTLIDQNGYMFVSYALPNSNCRAFEDDSGTCPKGIVSEIKTSHKVSPTKPIKLCLLFIVDVSGSMSGEKINQAKLSLLHIIEKLSDDDCIGIILFSSSVIRKTTGLVRVGDHRNQLHGIVQRIRASGLTNFDGALQDGVDMLSDFIENSGHADCVHVMVMLTDGHPTTGVTTSATIIQRFMNRLDKFNKDTRKILYPYFLGFGTNYDLDFDLLQKLAAKSSGFARRIYRGNDVKQQLVEFFKEIACPLLCSMQVNFRQPGLVQNVTKTDFAGCFFDGSQLLVSARIKNTRRLRAGSRVSLNGISSEGKKSLNSNKFISTENANATSLVERTWAYLQITQALEQAKQLSGEEKKALENEILMLSKQYKFVTRLTSLIVVKPCEDNSLGSVESVDEQGHTSDRPVISTSATARPSTTRPTTARPLTRGPSISHSIQPASYNYYNYYTYPAGVTSDPHFLVETLSNHWLCYTLKGTEGEVYNLLSDREYFINGLIISTVFKGSDQTYFGSISINHRSCETGAVTKFLVTADNGLAIIDEGSLSWEDVGVFTTLDKRFVITMNHTLVHVTNTEEDVVQFTVLRSELNCTKYSVCPRKHYLGFYVSDRTGLSSRAHGMIGQFLKQPTQIDGNQMEVGGRKLVIKPFERLNGLAGHYQKCWSTDAFGMRFLDGNADDYLVKDLFDSDFTYSNYHCN